MMLKSRQIIANTIPMNAKMSTTTDIGMRIVCRMLFGLLSGGIPSVKDNFNQAYCVYNKIIFLCI